MQRAFGASGTTILQNDGPPGQSVDHLHIHVIPRHVGDGYPCRAQAPESSSTRERQAQRLRAAYLDKADAPTS